jgi:pimeloyl-ACP methyl ester carboxylesterase
VVSRGQQTTVVRSSDVALAVTDWRGGPGPDIVLMPGLGGRQRGLAAVAARLPGWRVITMDLRGHGRSTDAPWSFSEAVADLHAVISHFGLEKPYVGGHSLGGMLGLQYALAGHPVVGVVNIDGWGPGVPGRYLGEDEGAVRTHLAQIAAGHLPSRLARVITSLTRQGRHGTTRQVFRELEGADVVAWHAAAGCPSLAFNAVGPASATSARLLGPEVVRLQRSHRAGLRRDLAALAEARPDVMVAEVDAGHQLIATHPDAVAAGISAFHERRGG